MTTKEQQDKLRAFFLANKDFTTQKKRKDLRLDIEGKVFKFSKYQDVLRANTGPHWSVLGVKIGDDWFTFFKAGHDLNPFQGNLVLVSLEGLAYEIPIRVRSGSYSHTGNGIVFNYLKNRDADFPRKMFEETVRELKQVYGPHPNDFKTELTNLTAFEKALNFLPINK